jgi:hypothetical protein
MNFPVTKAFAATLAYLSSHALYLLKVLWLPAALLTAAMAYALPSLFEATSALIEIDEDADPQVAMAALGAFSSPMLIVLIASTLFNPMLIVASLKHLVRGEKIATPFYLGFGVDELRVVGAFILLMLMLTVITIVGGLGVGVVAAIAALAFPGAKSFVAALADLLINAVSIWFRLRLSVLYPAALATRTTGFGVSWAETKGRVLGLLLFFILVGLVMAAIGLVFAAPFIQKFWPLFTAVVEAGDSPEAAREALRPFLSELSAMWRPENPMFGLFVVIIFVTTMINAAISYVASGTAWRFLTEGGERQ